MTRILRSAFAAALLLTLAACETQKSSNPLSPTVAGPIPGVNITAPRMLEPTQGSRYKESQQPIRLMVENASTSGVRPLFYTFELASDADFTTKMFARSGVPPGDGRTSVQIDRLELGRSYYWRVRAEDGANSGPFVTAQFEVLPRPQLGAPGPVTPISNAVASSRRPTFTAGAPERNAAVGPLTYEYHIAIDGAFGNIVAAGQAAEEGVQTHFTPGSDLPANQQHFWRVRAGDGETTSEWSAVAMFRTPGAAPAPPPPAPGPGPTPGSGSCALGNGPAIINCISVKYAAWRRPVGSLGERQGNMMFLRDRIIEAGQCSGMNLGYNLKRGGPERSIDVLAWKRPDGNMGVDIGMDYDNLGGTLQLVWSEVDLFAVFEPYPPVNCSGV